MNQAGASATDQDPAVELCNKLRVIRRNVRSKDKELTKLRNQQTIQAAILRGDSVVLLNDTDEITPDLRERLYLPFPSGHEYGYPRFSNWADEYGPPREGNYEYPNHLERDLELQQSATWDGFKLEFVKVIGRGGFGIATLWEVTFEDDSRLEVILKTSKSIQRTFQSTREAAWHKRYKGAGHIIQTIDLSEKRDYIRDRLTAAGRAWKFHRPEAKFDPEAFNLVVLEYASLGSLYDWAAKIFDSAVVLSDRQLWQLWECLVKGLASTSYTHTYNMKKNNPFDPDGEDDDEDFDALLRQVEGDPTNLRRFFTVLESREETHDVHFDLDESNILLSGEKDVTHKDNPFLKFNDFGLSQKMREQWTKNETFLWKLRTPPKWDRMTPEQFHRDWDNLTLGPNHSVHFRTPDLTQGYRIAGRYGSWTNVFLAGQIMEGLITGVRKSHPFKAKQCIYTNSDFHGPAECRETYGYRLDSDVYARVDEQLRQTIMRCLSEAPADRPKVMNLLKEVVHRRRTGWGETDDHNSQLWRQIFEPTPTVASSHASDLDTPPTSRPTRYKPPRILAPPNSTLNQEHGQQQAARSQNVGGANQTQPQPRAQGIVAQTLRAWGPNASAVNYPPLVEHDGAPAQQTGQGSWIALAQAALNLLPGLNQGRSAQATVSSASQTLVPGPSNAPSPGASATAVPTAPSPEATENATWVRQRLSDDASLGNATRRLRPLPGGARANGNRGGGAVRGARVGRGQGRGRAGRGRGRGRGRGGARGRGGGRGALPAAIQSLQSRSQSLIIAQTSHSTDSDENEA